MTDLAVRRPAPRLSLTWRLGPRLRWWVLTTLAARTLVAAALIAFALWRRDAAVGDRLALIASIVAVPVLATWRVAPLLALPRLLTLVGPYTDRAAATRPQPRYA